MIFKFLYSLTSIKVVGLVVLLTLFTFESPLAKGKSKSNERSFQMDKLHYANDTIAYINCLGNVTLDHVTVNGECVVKGRTCITDTYIGGKLAVKGRTSLKKVVVKGGIAIKGTSILSHTIKRSWLLSGENFF